MLEIPYRPRARVNFLSVCGVIGVAIGVVVHFGTYVDYVLSPNPLLLAWKIGIFPLAWAFGSRSRAWYAARPAGFSLKQMRLPHSEFRPYVPAWAPPFLAVLAAYAIPNLILSTIHYSSKGHGTLTATQAMHLTRGFSGLWLLFYAAGALFFLYVPADARPATESPASPNERA